MLNLPDFTTDDAATYKAKIDNAFAVLDSADVMLTNVAGTNTLTATGPAGMTAYVAGQKFHFTAASTNTGAVTININALGAKAVTKNGNVALVAGDIILGAIITITYDGSKFQMSVDSDAGALKSAQNLSDLENVVTARSNLGLQPKWTSAQLLGSGLVITGVTVPALAALNATDVAFIDPGISELRTYRFNGSTWSLVGSGLSTPTIGTPALAALNGTDVAFIDSASDTLQTYRFGFQLGDGPHHP